MMDWMKDPRETLLELLNNPLPGENAVECVTEMIKRLETARLYDTTVSATYTTRDVLVRNGDYRITREMLYAALAYNLLKAKIRSEKFAVKLALSNPSKPYFLGE